MGKNTSQNLFSHWVQYRISTEMETSDLEFRAMHFNFSTLATLTKDLCLLESQSELQQFSSMKDSCDQLET